MIRLLLSLLTVLALAGPAYAHKLRVFATVEGTTVKGYAFFVGGGRAGNTPWIARNATGGEVATGTTDAEGRYAFQAPSPASELTVTVDTREGHVASATLSAARMGAIAPTGGAPTAGTPAALSPSGASPAPTDEKIAGMVEAAVQRQLEPLMERIEQMDARLRFSDMISGVFLILGLAGMALWARGRRR